MDHTDLSSRRAGTADTMVDSMLCWLIMFQIAVPFLICFYSAILQTVRARLNPDYTTAVVNYLHQSFGAPESLLRSMASGNFILSGSRALDFFRPGSAVESSDWDFYTYHNSYCVGLAIQALMDSGVVFDDALQPLRDMLDAPARMVIRMHVDTIWTYIERADFYRHTGRPLEAPIDQLLQEIRTELTIDPYTRVMALPRRAVLHILRGRREPTYGPGTTTSVHIVTGHTTHNGTNQKVQLIFSPRLTPLQHIMAFYASSVQCFISAFGAVHLFHKLAMKREAYYWPNNSQHPPSASTALLKYSGRQWRFVATPLSLSSTIVDHSLKSRGSVLMPVKINTGLSPALHRVRAEAFANVRCQISEGETRFIATEPKSLRDVLQANRTARHLNRLCDPKLEAARRLARDHSVAFDRDGSFPYPAELSGV
ncbi:hypothetical protein KC331_g229 [Hortaea werneckii]|nr:hypothetical protein KC331_g229 [Hortaea werneckii]KAI7722705.1 hypothetical protein KC353_g266 [Hortaea werneckii]